MNIQSINIASYISHYSPDIVICVSKKVLAMVNSRQLNAYGVDVRSYLLRQEFSSHKYSTEFNEDGRSYILVLFNRAILFRKSVGSAKGALVEHFGLYCGYVSKKDTARV